MKKKNVNYKIEQKHTGKTLLQGVVTPLWWESTEMAISRNIKEISSLHWCSNNMKLTVSFFN